MPAPPENEALTRLRFALQGIFDASAAKAYVVMRQVSPVAADYFWKEKMQCQWAQVGIWLTGGDRVLPLVAGDMGDVFDRDLYEIEWPLDEAAKKKLRGEE
jgi:hypothetical protein